MNIRAPRRLTVSENRRYLLCEDGRPFFWLGDTAWELFHRLDRAEAFHYLENRASKGFTVIQAVALAELDGLGTPNAAGRFPLEDGDPARPLVAPEGEDDYWKHVDAVVERANELGLLMGFLPTWGNHWKNARSEGGVFDESNAAAYGEWLGRRYRDASLVWILGGDRKAETGEERAIIRALARGLRDGDGGSHLCTYHSCGLSGSAEMFHDEDWLDFNLRQNGHGISFHGAYDQTLADYRRAPAKPVFDGEPVYEEIPIAFDAARHGFATAADTRRALYWDLFSGAFGHTYGHNAVWQMWAPGRAPVLDPQRPWWEALDQPGAAQMQHARWLLESRPFLTRIPDPDLLCTGEPASWLPGAGTRRFVATRDEGATYAMVYAPLGRAFRVKTSILPAETLEVWWFSPRDGHVFSAGRLANREWIDLTPPDPGELLDWVLVLDDARQGYAAPGTRGGG